MFAFNVHIFRFRACLDIETIRWASKPLLIRIGPRLSRPTYSSDQRSAYTKYTFDGIMSQYCNA